MNRSGWMAVVVIGFTIAGTARGFAAEPASAADRAFVAKVSQGGAYEVEASKVAEMRGTAPDIKDLAVTEGP